MARAAVDPPEGEVPFWLSPWPRICLALVLVALGCFLRSLAGDEQKQDLSTATCLVRFLLIVVAMILAGSAVERMLRRLRPEEESRLEVASLTAVASLVPLLGYLSTPSAWDSAHLVLCACIIAGVLGTGLILLPVAYRKAAFVLLVFVHFGGILTAVLSVESQGQPAPWLTSQAWALFYRPYLGFMYLNNAYHFYSPEPGPPTLLWSYVIYENEDTKQLKGQWVYVPDRDTSPVPLHYQRLLALAESTNQLVSAIPDALFSEKADNRKQAGLRLKPLPVVMHPSLPIGRQYGEPQPYSKMVLASYARHLARTHEQLKDEPGYKFHSVKIYRVIHYILEPREMAKGFSPLDKTLFQPYFQGEFNAKGEVFYVPDLLQLTEQSFEALRAAKVPDSVLEKLEPMKKLRSTRAEFLDELTKHLGKEGRDLYQKLLLEQSAPTKQILVDDLGNPIRTVSGEALDKMDPFLYWLVPITRRNVAYDPKTNELLPPKDADADLVNGMEIHAKYLPALPKEIDAPVEQPQ